MKERKKFSGLNITRSIQDRIFLGVIGLIFMIPSGYMFYEHFKNQPTLPPNTSLGTRLLITFIFEIVLTVFVLAFCCFIWGIAAPRWIEKSFEKAISKFILMLAIISFLLFGIIIYIFSVNL
jgi:hypothetical protein